MQNIIKIKDLTLGDGQPKIAVSITAPDLTGIKHQLSLIQAEQPDLVEWRLDMLKVFPSADTLQKGFNLIKQQIPRMPLLVTFRTIPQGGCLNISEMQYLQFLQQLVKVPQVNLIDVEFNHDPEQVKKIVELAHQHGITVIMSSHNFSETPSKTELMKTMYKMQDMHADIAKVAVMPQNETDVLRFLQISAHAHQKLSIPVVTMAMGDLGKISRVSGALTGSAITFGSLTATHGSAAGQITVPVLKKILNQLAEKSPAQGKKTTSNESLDQLRQNINGIDHRLVDLLNRRFRTVHAVGILKKQRHLPTQDTDRETQVLEKIAAMSRPKSLGRYNQNIVQNIMDNSKEYENFLKSKN